MNESNKALRKAYRAQARAELRQPGFWIFTVLLYVITFSAVALLMYVDRLTGTWFFNVHHSSDEAPLVTAYFWANLILTCFLIAIAVLYIAGGPAGIPFLSSKKNENDKT